MGEKDSVYTSRDKTTVLRYLLNRQLWLILNGRVDVSYTDKQGTVHRGGKYNPGQVSWCRFVLLNTAV